MDLSKVVLTNFIDKRKVEDDDPNLSVQKVVKYHSSLDLADAPSSSTEQKRVLSLTKRHWDIYDSLIDDHNVKVSVLFGAVERYRLVNPCHFDQALEICLDMIWRVFELDEPSDYSGDVSDRDDSIMQALSATDHKTLH